MARALLRYGTQVDLSFQLAVTPFSRTRAVMKRNTSLFKTNVVDSSSEFASSKSLQSSYYLERARHQAKYAINYKVNRNCSNGVVDPPVEIIENIEDPFQILKITSHQPELNEQQIATVFFRILSYIDKLPDNKVSEFLLLLHQCEEFDHLCSVAESKVLDFGDDIIIDLFQASLKMLDHKKHSLVKALRCEALNRLDRLTISQLSKLAGYLRWLQETRSSSLGKLVHYFDTQFEQIKTLNELKGFMQSTYHLQSLALRQKSFDKMCNFVRDEGAKGLTPSLLKRILLLYSRVNRRDLRILHHLCELLLTKLHKMSPREICLVLLALERSGYNNVHFEMEAKGALTDKLKEVDCQYDVALCMYILGNDAPAPVKQYLEEIALNHVNGMSITDIQELAGSLKLLGYKHSCPLVTKFLERIKYFCRDFSYDNLSFITFLAELDCVDKEMWSMIEKRLYFLLNKALRPSDVAACIYYLSLLPCCPKVLIVSDAALRIAHQCRISTADKIYMSLKKIKEKLHYQGEETPERFLHTLETFSQRAICSIQGSSDPINLLGSLNAIASGSKDVVLIDTAFKTLESLSVRSKDYVIGYCKALRKAHYFSPILLEKISKKTLEDPKYFTPLTMLHIIRPFCHFNYYPKNGDDFFSACMERVVPFMRHLPAGYLVAFAQHLSLSQIFSVDLLKYIFSMDFLSRLDEELKEFGHIGGGLDNMYRRQMMYLNRSVTLECPELQVPWFHEEYCQEMMKYSVAYYSKEILEIQQALVETLGGAQYIRTFAFMPYYYYSTFECVLDSDGQPLPATDHGSVLNNVNPLTGVLMSDMMQWSSSSKQLPRGAQRVAIYFIGSSIYGINSHRLPATVTVRQRHAELLGYKVVTIPYYEWKNVQLQPQDIKEEYIKRKLFSKDKASQSIENGVETESLRDLHTQEEVYDLVAGGSEFLRRPEAFEDDLVASRFLRRADSLF